LNQPEGTPSDNGSGQWTYPDGTPVTAGQVCWNSKNESSCVDPQCQWEDYHKEQPKALYQAPFCHPTHVDNTTTAADWESCITHDNTTCPESTGQCAYDLGLDLQPVNKEYCAPTYLTSNVSVIM